MRFKALTFFAFLFVLLGVSLMSVVSAQTGAGSCSQTMASKNTNDFFNEIPTLNTNLGNCPITLPSSVNSLLGSGNVLVSVQMTDGSVKEFYLTLANSQITSITSGATTKFGYKIILSQSTLDKILQSSDKAGTILTAYGNKEIRIIPNGFVNRIKFFFAKFFIPKTTTTTTTTTQTGTGEGKPANCDETYLPGHRNYAENKVLWDSYTADTDGVCQSQFGRGVPSPCVHGVQLSIDGNPYYLCWYRN